MNTDEEESLAARRLADEVRRGVREVAPGGAGDADPEAPGLRAWSEAERHLVPSVPPGASLPWVKRALLRVLRIATRSQGSFNAKIVEGARALERSHARETRRLDAEIARLKRETDLLHARLNASEASPAGPRGVTPAAENSGGAPAAAGAPGSAIPSGLYARFEEEFRGSEEDIRARQAGYVEWFRGAAGPVLDCGCGRGEFVEALADAGIPAEGIDANPVAVARARARGVAAAEGDAFDRLRTARGTLGGVAALQFVEHLSPASVREFLGLAFEALAPGGRLLLETINPDSLYAMRAYRLDPSHVWPVPPRVLALFARDAGFTEKEIQFLSPVPPEESLSGVGENEAKLNRWIFGPQDYALFAERPAG